MPRLFSSQPLIAMFLLATAACTQAPAQVDLRGSNTYTRDGSSYASNTPANNYSSYQPAAGGINSAYHAPVPMQTQSSASYSSIGVSDLSSPKSSTSTPAKKSVWNSPQSAASPFKPAATTVAESRSTAAQPVTVASNTINPWTRTPRNTAASDALDESIHMNQKGKTVVHEQLVSTVNDTQAQGVKLDKIVSNENNKVIGREVSLTRKAQVADKGNGLMWPVNSHKVISQFGPKGKGKINDGINIASSDGEPVWASGDGEVVYVGNELQGYGNMVLIKHAGEKTTSYAHLSRYTVDKYDRVKQGDIIGYVGSTGNVKSPQLHFAVHEGKDPVDPLKLLKRDVASR